MDFAINLAGMTAATRRLEASAAEVARAAAGPPAGAAGAVPPAGAATRAPDAARSAAEPDLPAAMVEQIAASAAFLANVSALRRTDDALESLLRDP